MEKSEVASNLIVSMVSTGQELPISDYFATYSPEVLIVESSISVSHKLQLLPKTGEDQALSNLQLLIGILLLGVSSIIIKYDTKKEK